MRKHDYVGVAAIASGGRSLVQGRSMAENVLGLVLRQRGCLIFDHISVIRRAVLKKRLLRCYFYGWAAGGIAPK